MMLKPLVSKKAHLIAILYDLYHVPSLAQHDHLYVYNMGELSKLLFVGYVIERYGLWNKILRAIINRYSDAETEKYLEILDTIDIYNWDLVEADLNLTAEKVLKRYGDIMDEVVSRLRGILEIEKFYDEVYVIIGFNPLKGLYGSLLLDEDKYLVISVMAGVENDPDRIIDLAIHEILHGLIRLNKLPIREDIEEEFIDTLCPEGYLSKLLGLSDKLNVGEGYIQSMIKTYFNEKLYEKTSLIKYLRGKIRNVYLA